MLKLLVNFVIKTEYQFRPAEQANAIFIARLSSLNEPKRILSFSGNLK